MSTVGKARVDLSPLEVSIAGGTSGAITRLFCQPLDVAKIRLQLQVETRSAAKYRGLPHLLVSLPREEGLGALWKGHLPAQMLSVTYGLASFAAFESLARVLKVEESSGRPLARSGLHFLCGGVGGCAGTLASAPFDVLRTRLVAQNRPVYTSARNAASQLYKEAGFRAYFKGILPAMLATAPQAGLQFAFYSLLTSMMESLILYQDQITLVGSLSCGGLAGLCSKFLLYPLDVVKKRLQVSGWTRGRKNMGVTPYYGSLTQCITQIVRQEGFRGLYKGLSPALVKAVISTSLHFAVYEKVCTILMLKHQ